MGRTEKGEKCEMSQKSRQQQDQWSFVSQGKEFVFLLSPVGGCWKSHGVIHIFRLSHCTEG